MAYKIFRSNNYFVLIDPQGNYFEEECENVLVTKKKEDSKVYDIAFLRQETQSIRNLSYSFPDIAFSDIIDQAGDPYQSVEDWETFYQQNTGVGSIALSMTKAGLATESTLLAITKSKTPTSFASTGVTNVPIGATEVSIFNNGTGDGIVNGTKIPAGVTRTFGFNNPTSAVIVCDGRGTEELIIDYML